MGDVEAIIDVAAALMTPEDMREVAEAIRVRNDAADAYIAAMNEDDETRRRVIRRVLDRVPKSVFRRGERWSSTARTADFGSMTESTGSTTTTT